MTRARRLVAALAILVLAAAGSGTGCGKPRSARRGAAADSSFAAIAFTRGRPPLELSLASGKATYDRYCAICHGATGDGDGFNAYNVKNAYGVNPTAFSDSAAMASLKDADALAAIREGGAAAGKSPAMPGWGRTLAPGEAAEVWRYARSLASAHAP